MIGITDVSTAFLYAGLPKDRIILMTSPAILILLGLVLPGIIWKLNKALYGRKESPRNWATERDSKLKTVRWSSPQGMYKLRRCILETNLWSIVLGDDDHEEVVGVLCTYTDDLMVAADIEVGQALFEEIGKFGSAPRSNG